MAGQGQRKRDEAWVATAPLETPLGTARLYGTSVGLLAIILPGERRNTTQSWLQREARGAALVEDAAPLRDAAAQLTEYFAGARREFDVAIDWRGTPFQRAVWREVSAIPYGETSTYGEIALLLGRPNAARAVGGANGINPVAPIVPCHRLIGNDGSLRGYGAGLETKRWLLALERGDLTPRPTAVGAPAGGSPLLAGEGG